MESRNGNFQLKRSEIALVLGVCLVFASLFLIVVISNLGIPLIAESGQETMNVIASTPGWPSNPGNPGTGFGWIFSGG